MNAHQQPVVDWFGEDAISVIASADRVDLFRVDGLRGPGATESGATFAGCRVLREVVHQAGPLVEQWAGLLLDARHYDYDPNRGKGCLFNPGVGAEFHA